MPSPIGHALAGLAVALHPSFRAPNTGLWRPGWRLVLLCALVAALPDADLLMPWAHRTVTHSLLSTAFVAIIAAGVTGWVTPNLALPIGLLCGAAWGSHILLDLLGADRNPPRGIQLLWPFSDRWFKAGWEIFPTTERRDPLSWGTIAINARAALFEIVTMGSIIAAIWLARIRRGGQGR